MKKVISLIVVLAMLALSCFALTSCGENTTSNTLKVGAILVGDETEGYTLAHMNGIQGAVDALKAKGYTVEVNYKKMVPEGSDVETNVNDLIANGCQIIITNSYGHQFYFGDTIKNNPDVTFVAMTGDLATSTGLSNYFNAFTDVYESRYASGVVAGYKLKELLDNGLVTSNNYDAAGNVKIGYVGAFNYAEVVSGYTAFFLGIKSVVSNVSMTVKYTNSWFSVEREAAVAEYLMAQGCVIIGQHADSTGAPAAVEAAHKNGTYTNVYSVGYNVSMLDVAPTVALTSPTNNWEVYYETLFTAVATKSQVPAEWAEGYSQKAVGTTELGKSNAASAQAALDATVKGIKDGSIKVFNCDTFTVKGEKVTSYTNSYGFEGNECIVTKDGVTYFDESSLRAAPYFDLRIDGITEVASDYAD